MSDRFEQRLLSMAKREKIKIPHTLEDKIDYLLSGLSEKRKVRKISLRKILIPAAALIMLFSITATASIGLLRERMEAMNQAKLEEFFDQIYESKRTADNYNRYYTDSEKERKKTLEKAYEKDGIFPEGELTLIDKAKDYRGRGVAYLVDTGTFFFPDKEMSDEQLLQIIDFIRKRDYSLQKVNEMIAAGDIDLSEILDAVPEIEETDSTILGSDAIWNPGQELTIAYTGDLSIETMAAGRQDIYLGGWNAVHRMEIGNSSSQVFYDDFEKETKVACLYVDNAENVYIVGAELEIEMNEENIEYSIPDRSMVLWKVDKEGNLLKTFRFADLRKKDIRWVMRMAVDEQGYIYLRIVGDSSTQLAVLDTEGNLVSMVSPGQYYFSALGGLGPGKDGKMYTMVSSQDERKGIAAVNPEEGRLGEVYMGIVPDETLMLDIIAPGSDSDLVLWGYDGIFSYNLGEENTVNVLPAYEAPCSYEGVRYCALTDGRIVFASGTEYVEESYGAGYTRFMSVPEKMCFYYQPSLRD